MSGTNLIGARIRGMAPKITDPSYISEHMLDKVVKEKFHDNPDDAAVRNQMIKFLQMFGFLQTRLGVAQFACRPML